MKNELVMEPMIDTIEEIDLVKKTRRPHTWTACLLVGIHWTRYAQYGPAEEVCFFGTIRTRIDGCSQKQNMYVIVDRILLSSLITYWKKFYQSCFAIQAKAWSCGFFFVPKEQHFCSLPHTGFSLTTLHTGTSRILTRQSNQQMRQRLLPMWLSAKAKSLLWTNIPVSFENLTAARVLSTFAAVIFKHHRNLG